MRVIVAIGLLAFFSPAAAQSDMVPPGDPAAAKMAADLLERLKDGSANGDMARFFAKNELFRENLSQVELLESQTDAGLKLYGPVRGWRLLDSIAYGGFAVQDRYLVQHDKSLTLWTFDFARLPTGLVPAAVVWNDQFPSVAADKRKAAQ